VPIDLPNGTRLVDVAGEGDVIAVAAVGDDVSLSLVEPIRMRRPWVAFEGDRVISLRLVDGVVEAVLDTPDGTVRISMPDGWASPDPADWDTAPTVEPFPRTPAFLEYFDGGLLVGTERIGDESLPGRVIVSTDDGTTWTEFDLGSVSDFGSVGGVPVVIGGAGPVVYRVEPGPPVTLVPTDAGDVFETPPRPLAGGLASSVDPAGSSYTYLASLDAAPEIVRLDGAGIDGQLVGVTREGLAITIDDDTGDRFLYRWRGMSTVP
jgi:hypothetical protein